MGCADRTPSRRAALRSVLWTAILALALMGCPDDPEITPPDDDDIADDDDTAQVEDLSIEFLPSELIPTVFTARLHALDGTIEQAMVEFGLDDGYGTEVAAELTDEGEVEALLLGMKASREYHVRAVATVDGEELASTDAVVETGPVPSSMPEIFTATHDPELATGGFMALSLMSIPPVALILDGDGDPVWWYIPQDESYQVIRATLSRDKTEMLYFGSYAVDEGEGDEDRYLVRVALDGSDIQIMDVPGAHHDFVELPDGTVAFIANDRRTVEGTMVNGTCIREYHPDGTEDTVWTIWDHMEYDPGLMDHGWVHANALDYDEEGGLYYLGSRNYNGIFKIHRDSGQLAAIIGGDFSDYASATGQTNLYEQQHQFDIKDNRIVVFDNQSVTEYDSRVVEYTLDHETMEAELAWSYRSDPPIFCFGLGDANRLPGGNTLVTWSTSSLMDEVMVDGTVVLQIATAMGAGMGYTSWYESLY